MVNSKRPKKGPRKQQDVMNITLRSAVGDPPATLIGANKWITRWLMMTKASGAALTVGDISGALNTISSKDSLRIMRVQAFSPMDTIGQSLTFSVVQENLIPQGTNIVVGVLLPVLQITDFGTGTARASAQADIPRNGLLYAVDSGSVVQIATATASGATPGPIVYRVKIAHTV